MLSHTAIMRVLYIHPTAGFWTAEASEAVKTSWSMHLDRYHLWRWQVKSCNWSYTLCKFGWWRSGVFNQL